MHDRQSIIGRKERQVIHMVIYGEMLILENIVTGSVLLYITGEVFGSGFETVHKKLRLAVGSIMCGLFSLLLFCQLNMLLNVLAEMAFALAVCSVVFGYVGVYKKAVVFVLATYFMGGITMGLLLAAGNTGIYTVSGVYTGEMKAAVLAMFTAVFFAASKQIIKTFYKSKLYVEHSFSIEISAGGQSVEAAAFLDTGNSLKEPITGRPVAVAESGLWLRMKDEGMITEDRFCVIPYRTVGSEGLMKAVRVDYILIDGRYIRNCIIAKNDMGFNMKLSGNKECELLLSKYMAHKGV